MSKLFVMAIPIPQGKEEDWQNFADEFSGSWKEKFKASRQKWSVHERTFYQRTSKGCVAIITLEGQEPKKAFQQFISSHDDFTKWFLENIKAIQNVDLAQLLSDPESELSELFIDSEV